MKPISRIPARNHAAANEKRAPSSNTPVAARGAPSLQKSAAKIAVSDKKFLAFVRRMRAEGRISPRVKVVILPNRNQASASWRNNDLLTPKEAGNYLSLSANTLANWRSSGKGPKFSKFGASIRYRFDDLVSFTVGHAAQNTSKPNMSIGGSNA